MHRFFPLPLLESPVYRKQGALWIYFIIAQLSFLTTLSLPYQGEEAVYTITSMEMALHQQWCSPTEYGALYGRPPLYNWLIIALVRYLGGWQQVLVAARCVTALATLGSSLMLMWTITRIKHDRLLGLVAGLVYLSGDVLFRRGWLAYADPVFAFFSFSALAFLWVAIEEQRFRWIMPAMFCLIGSFLTKALTGYVFYGIGLSLLFCLHPNRRFLWRWPVIIAHCFAGLFLWWWYCVMTGPDLQAGRMISDMTNKWQWSNLRLYLYGLVAYPLETVARWLPCSAVLFYLFFKKKPFFQTKNALLLLCIVGFNYLPYWLAPHKHIRYLMPLYPLIAWLLAEWIYQQARLSLKTIKIGFSMILIVRYGLGLFWFPFYQTHYRGDYRAIARDILKIAQDKNKTIYANDKTAVGLSVVANLDSLLMPKTTIQYPPSSIEKIESLLLSDTPAYAGLRLYKSYTAGTKKLYLLCGGLSCDPFI